MTQWTTMTPDAHADWLAAYPRPVSATFNVGEKRIEHYDGDELVSFGVRAPDGKVHAFSVRQEGKG